MLLTADFETTTNEDDCRVWAYGVSEIGRPDNFTYGNNIDDFMEYARKSKNSTFYFHNLKFDGDFLMIWLFENGFTHVTDRKDLVTKTFTTLISNQGQFYSMKIVFKKQGKRSTHITIFDSLKILPFSVNQIARGFNLPMAKGEIDYHTYRKVGHELTDEEIEYIRLDVEIVASALDVLFKQGLDKMTQGSNALFDYIRTVSRRKFEQWFPIPDYDHDIRQSYRGGFTYLNPKYQGIDVEDGIVLDVNSLYPSVMHGEVLPYGEGIYFEGEYEEDSFYNLYVQAFSCQFELKEGHIPTIQLKNNLAFVPTDYLSDSGDEDVIMYMTNIDLQLFKEHYHVYNIEYLSGWKFKSTDKLFKEYIDKWSDIKIQSKIEGNYSMYVLSKLMLNALYGKFALNPNVQSKIPYYDDGMIKFYDGEKDTRDPLYIPVGAFVTSYAREKTIRAAQSVYDRFIYADTDSLHLIGKEVPSNLDIDDLELGKWSHESTFTRARFLRQKSYIEEIDGKLEITCAGLPDSCHQFVTWENFHEGVSYEGKLQARRVKGGIVLKETTFNIIGR